MIFLLPRCNLKIFEHIYHSWKCSSNERSCSLQSAILVGPSVPRVQNARFRGPLFHGDQQFTPLPSNGWLDYPTPSLSISIGHPLDGPGKDPSSGPSSWEISSQCLGDLHRRFLGASELRQRCLNRCAMPRCSAFFSVFNGVLWLWLLTS